MVFPHLSLLVHFENSARENDLISSLESIIHMSWSLKDEFQAVPTKSDLSTDLGHCAFSWLKAATTAFTFKTLLRHFAKQTLTPRSLNVKLGPQHNYHKGPAAIRHFANQTARPL